MKRFFYKYTNDLGRKKEIWITKDEDKYTYSLWDLATGEHCGSGESTKEDLIDFLSHYEIKAEI